jgi:hypothetical protein
MHRGTTDVQRATEIQQIKDLGKAPRQDNGLDEEQRFRRVGGSFKTTQAKKQQTQMDGHLGHRVPGSAALAKQG